MVCGFCCKFEVTTNQTYMSNLQLPEEIWKDIPTQEGFYQISTYGRIRSLDHYTYRNICKQQIFMKGRVLKVNHTVDGYRCIRITGGPNKMTLRIHRMMWVVFNGTVPKGYEVDHIDNDKENNLIGNLQLLKTRHNSAKRSMNLKKSSRFTGVCHTRNRKAWQAHIRINGKSTYLGTFDNEIDASIAYQKALQSLENKVA
jgi:hypothetical protein